MVAASTPVASTVTSAKATDLEQRCGDLPGTARPHDRSPPFRAATAGEQQRGQPAAPAPASSPCPARGAASSRAARRAVAGQPGVAAVSGERSARLRAAGGAALARVVPSGATDGIAGAAGVGQPVAARAGCRPTRVLARLVRPAGAMTSSGDVHEPPADDLVDGADPVGQGGERGRGTRGAYCASTRERRRRGPATIVDDPVAVLLSTPVALSDEAPPSVRTRPAAAAGLDASALVVRYVCAHREQVRGGRREVSAAVRQGAQVGWPARHPRVQLSDVRGPPPPASAPSLRAAPVQRVGDRAQRRRQLLRLHGPQQRQQVVEHPLQLDRLPASGPAGSRRRPRSRAPVAASAGATGRRSAPRTASWAAAAPPRPPGSTPRRRVEGQGERPSPDRCRSS